MVQPRGHNMQRKAPPRGVGEVLTLDAYLLHLRHLRDRLLQVLHELEELFCALGTEVEHLFLVGAEGRDDGDAVGVVWRSRSRLEAGEQSRCARGRRGLTFVFKQVELHAEEAHGFAKGVRRRALLLRTKLQDLRGHARS